MESSAPLSHVHVFSGIGFLAKIPFEHPATERRLARHNARLEI